MKLITVLLTCLFTCVVLAAEKIETIQLNHRLASEVLPEVQAFLPKSAAARAYNEIIIIKADSAVIDDIKQLIIKLDTPPQRVRVSLLKTDEVLTEQQRNPLSATLELNRDTASNGASLIRRWSTNKSQNKERNFQAQGIAGKPMLIMMGQEIPQREQYLYFSQFGDVEIQSNTSYISLQNGFQAVATILPNNHVIIAIHPHFSSLSPRNGTLTQSEVISTVTGAAGSWIELGQLDNEKNLEKQSSTSYHTHRQQQKTIYIKVDQL